MSSIRDRIDEINKQGKKALTVFITAGSPTISDFSETACRIIEAGADLLEIGMPFSDPLADGGVIQKSSQIALQNGITQKKTFKFVEEIKRNNDIPILLMGYANTILRYDPVKFELDSINAGVDGLIIPDVPLEEFDDFFASFSSKLDKVLLTTPTSSNERISLLDQKSSGFLYCVSVAGTTGVKDGFSDETINNINRTYNSVKKNKMQIGFGISKPENIKQLYPYTDGFIVGSAVVRSLQKEGIEKTAQLVRTLSNACKN